MKPLLILLFSIIQITCAQNSIRNRKFQEAQLKNNEQTSNPFLSTTLSSKITFSQSASSYDLTLDSARKSIFSETLGDFLTKIFQDQQVYDLKIISVNIFDDHILKEDGHFEDQTSQQMNDAQRTLSFSTVVAAEYTRENEINSIANKNYRQMLVHVCDKFQGHLLQFMKDTGDPYFMGVESIVLGDFEKMYSAKDLSVYEDRTDSNSKVMGMSGETLNIASIVAIVVGSIVFVVSLFFSVKYYRHEQELKSIRWTSKEIASINAGTISFTNSPGEVGCAVGALDDYSFDPLGTNNEYNERSGNGYNVGKGNGYNGTVYRDDPIHINPSIHEYSTSAATSGWPESAPPTMFPVMPALPALPPPAQPKLSYTEELQKLPKQHVFAPPGKIGVAIDVLNGQPTVHKVRKGSPLENMLQTNDIITSIDDEDTSCLSAADVTSMMVKRMDRVRKITFIRRG